MFEKPGEIEFISVIYFPNVNVSNNFLLFFTRSGSVSPGRPQPSTPATDTVIWNSRRSSTYLRVGRNLGENRVEVNRC